MLGTGKVIQIAESEKMTMRIFAAKLLVAGALGSLISPVHAQESNWRPLDPARFGQELIEPWIKVPDGSSGAPRQGWLNTADGFFTREAHLAYERLGADRADTDRGLARFNYPFSRRLWAGLEIPFVKSSGGKAAFGDLTLTTQVMLAETRDLSVNAGVGYELPTGERRLGDGVLGAIPQVNLWADIGAGVAVRGRLAYAIRDRNGQDGFIANLALGQTITPPEATPLGQFTYYLSANLFQPDKGATFFSLTPGIRTRVAGDLFFLAGVEVPVVAARGEFNYRAIGQLVYGF